MPILILFIIPFLGAFLSLLFSFLPGRILKGLAFSLSTIPFFILLYFSSGLIGIEANYEWMPAIGVHFHLSVDSLSFLFLFLVAIVVPVSIIAADENKLSGSGLFYGFILLVQGFLIGFFTARDLALFTFFWEAMLIPLYFLIGYWGGDRARPAALKFLVYMIAGAALLVAAVLALYNASGTSDSLRTFDLDRLAEISEKIPYARTVFVVFILAFAVKTPLFPFHGWLPETYYEAPTSGTILLSSLLSKAGIYGILRIGIGLFPDLMREWGPSLIILAIVGVLYAGLAAWRQTDYKKLIAYSSLSHVNFILAGLFVWNQTARTGSILQALNHGITIAALFLVADWLTRRIGTTEIGSYKGLARYMPNLAWLSLFFAMASVALPGTNNFVGELVVLFGVFQFDKRAAAVLALTMIFSAMYMLKWIRKVYFEEPSPFRSSWIDIQAPEIATALPLLSIILWIGIYPAPVLNRIKDQFKYLPATESRIASENSDTSLESESQ